MKERSNTNVIFHICDLYFAMKSNLRKHIATVHGGEMPFTNYSRVHKSIENWSERSKTALGEVVVSLP